MPDVATLKGLCAALPGAEATEHGPPSNVLVYRVGGRPFAWFKTSAPERWRFSLRVSPDRFLELTDQPGVKPARFMARYHWVTIVDVAAFDDAYLRELLRDSHAMAVARLSRRRQAALRSA